jgi:hypothetical protein
MKKRKHLSNIVSQDPNHLLLKNENKYEFQQNILIDIKENDNSIKDWELHNLINNSENKFKKIDFEIFDSFKK